MLARSLPREPHHEDQSRSRACSDRNRGPGVAAGGTGRCPGSANPPDQMVATLKQNLAESQKRLRQYEWVETTTISLKGEQKSSKQQRVYYGADGKLTKLPMGDPPAQAAAQGGGRGGRGGGRLKEKVVENKKDEMAEYMEKAAALIHQYVPPNPEQIQKAKDAGNMACASSHRGARRVPELRSTQRPDGH